PYPITQPGVFQQVSRLEDDLGCALFERIGKDRVRLTSAGRVLYDFVAPFLEGLRAVESAITQRAYGGTLRVQTAGLHLKSLIPQWARRVGKLKPAIALEVKESRRVALDALLAGECDLIVDHLSEVPAGIRARQIGRMQAFLALPASHRLAARKRVQLEQLQADTFVVYNTDLGARTLQLQALARAGVAPKKLLSADSADAILGLVAAGLGVGLIPWNTPAGPHVAGVVVHRVPLPKSALPIHAAWRTSLSPDPLIEAALGAFET
ncbi:MAG: LysR family transcriptional regulator, partial [Deltaproteobacteria bacterium]|nr:LysR family transcriptional regulator [Deltaproteobacteria bacterium]